MSWPTTTPVPAASVTVTNAAPTARARSSSTWSGTIPRTSYALKTAARDSALGAAMPRRISARLRAGALVRRQGGQDAQVTPRPEHTPGPGRHADRPARRARSVGGPGQTGRDRTSGLPDGVGQREQVVDRR